jgi:hypothetical protein
MGFVSFPFFLTLCVRATRRKITPFTTALFFLSHLVSLVAIYWIAGTFFLPKTFLVVWSIHINGWPATIIVPLAFKGKK